MGECLRGACMGLLSEIGSTVYNCEMCSVGVFALRQWRVFD